MVTICAPLEPLRNRTRPSSSAYEDCRDQVGIPLLIRGEPVLSPRGRRPISASNRNLDNFPPGKPTRANIANICRKTRTIVTYGPENLPQTGFSHLSRQGNAINSVEEGYARCCSQSEKLRCALEVWKNGMDDFCTEEFSVKTSHYHCCKKRGAEREPCFSAEAPNPNYISSAPLLEVGGADSPSLPRPRSLKSCSSHSPNCLDNPEGKYKLSDLAFPPGEPKTSNIQNICKLRKYRPLYTEDVLPNSGFGHYVRRAKAIYWAESELKKCCKTEDVACAHRGWQKAVSKFCTKELEVKSKHYECCKKKDQASMFHCFASEAPFPEYDKEVENLNLGNITESILEKVCAESKLLTKQKQLPLLVSGLKDSCCSLPQDKKLLCAQEQKEKFMKTMCGPKKDSWKDTQNCCSKDELEREECFSFYLQNISMAVSHRMMEE
ncbi:PREDICTED: extracellular matrix protein 1 [Nanorana parkeri]|uniref:extracellular matrix protein 1 n=1 Tax=Nanorana parkeri TaxID=125878 RepID=UPI000854F9D0|nr:PREDICTED: extracellular matrix protein 1 [Nanorana parkeri]